MRPVLRGPRAILSASSRADFASDLAGTTLLTRPILRASSASRGSPSSNNSMALLNPMRRGRKKLPPQSGASPTRTKAWMNRASSEAIRKSQARARLHPAPAATPFTEATTIFSMPRIRKIMGLYLSRSDCPREPRCSRERPLRSWPAQKARPAPVISMHRVSSSRSASRSASNRSLFIWGVKAFSAWGRFRVMVATPFPFS